MPNNLMTTDTAFPEIRNGEDVQKSIQKIMDYLFMSREQLTYTLSNLGIGNINRRQFALMGDRISTPINARIEDINGNVTQIQADAQGLSVRVEAAEDNIDGLTGAVVGNTTNIATLALDAQGLALRVESTEGDLSGLAGEVTRNTTDIATITVTADEISSTVSSLSSNVSGIEDAVSGLSDTVGNASGGLVYNVSQLQQTATELTSSVQSIDTAIGTDATPGTLKYRIAQAELSATGVATRVTSLEGTVGINDTTAGTLRYRMSQMEQTATGFATTVAMTSAIDTAKTQLQTNINTLGGELDDLADEVAGFGSGYVSLSKATQTATGFSWTVRDASNNSLLEFTNAGLTIRRGKLIIKNNAGTDVFYADANGNLTLKSTITASTITSSTISGGTISAAEFLSYKSGTYYGNSAQYGYTLNSNGLASNVKYGAYVQGHGPGIYSPSSETFPGAFFLSVHNNMRWTLEYDSVADYIVQTSPRLALVCGNAFSIVAGNSAQINVTQAGGQINLNAPGGVFANGIQIA